MFRKRGHGEWGRRFRKTGPDARKGLDFRGVQQPPFSQKAEQIVQIAFAHRKASLAPAQLAVLFYHCGVRIPRPMDDDGAIKRVVVGRIEPDQPLRATVLSNVVVAGHERPLARSIRTGAIGEAVEEAGVPRIGACAVGDKQAGGVATRNIKEMQPRFGRWRRKIRDGDAVMAPDCVTMPVKRGQCLAHDLWIERRDWHVSRFGNRGDSAAARYGCGFQRHR